MKINSTRFGEIEVKEAEFIVMKGAIIGFEHLKQFVLLINDEKTPLWWLQCIDDPSVAFVVINPSFIKPDYEPAFIERDLELLDIKKMEEIALLTIVTIRSHPFQVTANLRAPILINAENRMASQVVLEDPSYPIQYNVLDNRTNVDMGLSKEAVI